MQHVCIIFASGTIGYCYCDGNYNENTGLRYNYNNDISFFAITEIAAVMEWKFKEAIAELHDDHQHMTTFILFIYLFYIPDWFRITYTLPIYPHFDCDFCQMEHQGAGEE